MIECYIVAGFISNAPLQHLFIYLHEFIKYNNLLFESWKCISLCVVVNDSIEQQNIK